MCSPPTATATAQDKEAQYDEQQRPRFRRHVAPAGRYRVEAFGQDRLMRVDRLTDRVLEICCAGKIGAAKIGLLDQCRAEIGILQVGVEE